MRTVPAGRIVDNTFARLNNLSTSPAKSLEQSSLVVNMKDGPPSDTDLCLFMDIPLPATAIVSTPEMIFDGWLPFEENDAIIVESGDLCVRLWFDENCVDYPSMKSREEMGKWANPMMAIVHTEVRAAQIPPNLASCIEQHGKGNPTGNRDMDARFTELAARMYHLALSRVNRLITYCRTFSHQYWLQEYSLETGNMGSSFAHFRARARLGNGPWIRWLVPNSYRITLTVVRQEDWIGRDRWAAVKEFVGSENRPTLELEMLSDAWWFLGIGRGRSSVTHAVTALELALSNFASNPATPRLRMLKEVDRMDLGSLKAQVEHLGLSASVRHLLPLIFPENVLSAGVLQTCSDAIMVRQNVVHGGQRIVTHDKNIRYLKAIECAVETLMSHTASNL